MATHSSVLAWRIPGMGKPGGLLSMGSHRVRQDWRDSSSSSSLSFKLTCNPALSNFMARANMVTYCYLHSLPLGRLKNFDISFVFYSSTIIYFNLFFQLYWETSSVQFSHSVMSDSLWPNGLQHARCSCPSPTPRDYLNSCSLSQWCHPTISSSVAPFSSCLQSFLASGSFPMC